MASSTPVGGSFEVAFSKIVIGYGLAAAGGPPSQASISRASADALEHLTTKLGVAPHRIVLVGQSVGAVTGKPRRVGRGGIPRSGEGRGGIEDLFVPAESLAGLHGPVGKLEPHRAEMWIFI